jgi:hypothetical protein
MVDRARERWIVVRRSSGVTVAANLGDTTVAVHAEGTVILRTDAAITTVAYDVILPPRSAAVVLAEDPAPLSSDDHSS